MKPWARPCATAVLWLPLSACTVAPMTQAPQPSAQPAPQAVKTAQAAQVSTPPQAAAPATAAAAAPVLMAASAPAAASAPFAQTAHPESTETKLVQATLTPLSDLNLVQQPIPPLLLAAQKAPYATAPRVSCRALADEIAALDAELGPDLDAPPSPEDLQRPQLLELISGEIGYTAIHTVRNAAEAVIPLRRWVRKLTGAERHAKDVAAAIAAATARRAYLKGVRKGKSCRPSAAPAQDAGSAGQ